MYEGTYQELKNIEEGLKELRKQNGRLEDVSRKFKELNGKIVKLTNDIQKDIAEFRKVRKNLKNPPDSYSKECLKEFDDIIAKYHIEEDLSRLRKRIQQPE